METNRRSRAWCTVFLSLCAVVGALAVAALFFDSFRVVGISAVRAWIAPMNGEQSLIIDGDDHPPWARSDVILARFDQENATITVVEEYSVFNLVGADVNRGWPVIVDRRRAVLPSYIVRYWNGDENMAIGRLVVHGHSMCLLPASGKPLRPAELGQLNRKNIAHRLPSVDGQRPDDLRQVKLPVGKGAVMRRIVVKAMHLGDAVAHVFEDVDFFLCAARQRGFKQRGEKAGNLWIPVILCDFRLPAPFATPPALLPTPTDRSFAMESGRTYQHPKTAACRSALNPPR